MRIAFLVHAFPELSETFILRQVTGLIDRGHDVSIFADGLPGTTVTHPDVDAYDLSRRVRLIHPHDGGAHSWRRYLAIASYPTIARGYLGSDTHEPLLTRVRNLSGLRALETERPYDIVHCHFGDIGLRYRFAADLWNAPLIVSFYGFDVPSSVDQRSVTRYGPLTREARAVTVLSREMAGRVSALGFAADRIHTIPLCVDPERFHAVPRPNNGPLRVLSIARLVPKKGIEYGLRAFAAVATQFPTAHYDIIGDGPLRTSLSELCDQLGLAGRVTFHGWRRESDVLDSLRRADVFMLPSVTAPNGDTEGTPVAILEAASCGVPVVSTRHAGIPEIVLDSTSGLLSEERDVDGLAASLTQLLGNAGLREQFGNSGRAHVSNVHACDRVIRKLETLYSTVTR